MPSSYTSLYVHFPFCETKCHYCDFYSLGREKTLNSDATTFELALLKECELITQKSNKATAVFNPLKLDSIFFGGGTPTMTPVASMKRALAPLKLSRNEKIEWTMEANPSSLLDAYKNGTLKEYREFGVNRVSMGVQATQDHFLKLLGRVHDRGEVEQALCAIQDVGFTNYSCDLLCGVPGQTIDDIRESLEWLTSFGLKHLSCYLLTLTKSNRLYKDLPHEDIQLEHLLFVDDWMKSQGFEHYEISNYAKPGFEARHNLHYWKGSSYLGLGPSAHSFDASKKRRFKNISSLHRYAETLAQNKLPIDFEESLNREQLELEKWMLGLRLAEGFPQNWLSTDNLKNRTNTLIEKNLLEPHPMREGFFRPTARGFALSDQVIKYLI